MNSCIRPGPREVQELQRRCYEECQPYIDLMVREISMDTRTAWCFREDGKVEWRQPEETATMKHLRAVVDGIVKRYAALALGEEPARNAAGHTNL